MSTSFDKVKEIFLVAALKETPAERAAFLDEACAGDAVLRRRLEALLDADAVSGALVDRPAVEPAATAAYEPIAEGPGSLFGPYKLLQKIGEGGMGLVFMAEQQRPVKRKVALKVIKPGMDSKTVVARFEAERQTLALMNHPHIAQVFDAGETESGRPYFVMELVRGVPITDYCDQNNLTPRERLGLFVPVCHAVQHAHQKGVIHRDLKPSNVMVTLHDGRPVPKVIDFGVSKAIHQEMTERTLFTNFAQMVGTPLYMSPEQAEMSSLDIDTRTDIYSLGVLLYELITGETPFDRIRLRAAGYDEIRRIIREEDPPTPSTRLSTLGEALSAVSTHRKTDPRKLSQLVRGDLDWIVMKSLEKDRTRRYSTASEFAADIERHLNDEPVIAGPPSVSYRLRKFARRHRGPVMATAAMIVALALGLTASLFLYAGSERLRRAAEVARVDADVARAAVARRASELNAALGEATAARNLKNEALAAKEIALERSEALRLTTHSTNVLPANPGLALLLATEAARRGPHLAAVNNALLAALDECRELRTLAARPSFSDHEPEPLAVRDVAYSRDGSRLVTMSAGAIYQRVMVNTRTDLFGKFQGPETLPATLRLVVATVHVWDAGTGRLLTAIPAPPNQYFNTVQISPDGRLLAATFGNSTLVKYSGGETHLYTDRVVRLYDALGGRELESLRGHTDHVVVASFSPDSRRVLTASSDRTARLWDISTGEGVPGFLVKSSSSFDAAEFSPDGRRVLTLSRGAEQGKEYADGPKRNDPERPTWKIDPPAAERTAVRALALGEYGHWSRGWSASPVSAGNGQAEAGARRGAWLWDAESGAAIPEWQPADSPERQVDEITTVAHFSPDGRRVVIGTSNGTVIVRARESALESLRFSPRKGNGIRSIEFSRDGRRLLVCYDDGEIAVHDCDSGQAVTSPTARPQHVGAAFLDSDGRRVFVVSAASPSGTPVAESQGQASAGAPGSVAVLDAGSLQETGALRGHSDRVTGGCLSPDGRQFATCSVDGTARIWDAHGPAPYVRTIAPARAASSSHDQTSTGRAPVHAPTLSRDGRLMLAADLDAYRRGESKELGRIIELATGHVISRLMLEKPIDEPFFREGVGELVVAEFSPDGKRLLLASSDRRVRILKPGTTSSALGATAVEQWAISKELPFEPVRVWDVATGRELFHPTGFKSAVDRASFSPDGARILTRSTRGESYCYVRPEDGQVVSTGGHRMADPGAFIRIWDAASGRLLWTVKDRLNPAQEWQGSIVWGPDSHSFAASKLFGWLDFENKKLNVVPFISSGDELLFGPNGKNLLSWNSDQAALIEVPPASDAGSPAEQYELAEHRAGGEAVVSPPRTVSRAGKRVPLGGNSLSIVAAEFSGDGVWLAAASADHTIKIWDSGTGKLRHTLHGHTRPASWVRFSGDGKWLVTASSDHTARVWNVSTGAEFVTIGSHTGPVRSAVFGPSAQSVITSSADGTVRSMPLDLLRIALERKPRELTPEERARFETGE